MNWMIVSKQWFAALMLVVFLVPAGVTAQPGRSDEKPENLQVLPETMSLQQVRRVMFQFTNALGVRCLYCHVGEEGKPSSTYDFVSDEKEVKETTRAMMRMVNAINGDHITQLPDGDERIKVNCQTCHHGLAKPQLLQDLLTDHFSEHGVEETMAHYEELREEYHGGFSYNFQEGTLNQLSQRLLSMGEADAALVFLKRNIELHPESAGAHTLMAECHVALGDNDAAIESLEKALALNPRNRRAQERLNELKGGN